MSQKKGLAARIPAVTWVAILIAALYAGWIFYSRWKAGQEAIKVYQAQEAERARKEVELNGGTTLKIMSLYAPSSIAKGQSAQLCYGVANAKNVRFEPVIDDVWPSRNRCVDVSPSKTTTYKLFADDGAGHSDSAEVTIQVK